MTKKLGLVLGLTLATELLTHASSGWAGNYNINPVQVYLKSKGSTPASKLLAVRNNSTEPLRLQLTVFTWNESIEGKAELEPTEDVILFPSLITVAPGESRNVRLAIPALTPDREKTYRLIAEELPALETKEPKNQGPTIPILLKMSIPIFLQPDKPIPQGDMRGMAVRGGQLSFQLVNNGNAHYVAQEIKIRATNASSQAVFEKSITGWYILAGGTRQYQLDLPQSNCKQVTTLSISVKTEQTTFQRALSTPAGICQ